MATTPCLSRRDFLGTMAIGAAATAVPRAVRAATSADTPAARPFALTDAHRDTLRGVINDAITRKVIPGAAVVVLSRGQVVLREAYGRAEFESERPFTVDAPCFIASLSKAISATYLVSLDERGLLSLDDPVEKYLPQFKGVAVQGKGTAKTTMRVWHLLCHRSGLPGNADMGDARPQRQARAAAATGEDGAAAGDYSFEQVIGRWIKDGLLAEPGARFAYGSSGYMVAGRIAEVVLGRRFEQLLQQGLLDPVGMKRTTFHPSAETLSRLPARYASTPNGTMRDARTMTLPLPAADGLINPAGGLCSTLDDMAAFVGLHLNRGQVGGKQLIKAESLARMYRPHPPRATEAADGGGVGYGLGWNVIAADGLVRHLGASGTLMWLDLRRQHAGVLLTQVKWGPSRALIPRLMKEVQGIFPAL
ncbi:MAG TPA: serine hydrolase domain-containing protein [Opitutaceae bacterium]|nr:serine hydrolase domain-containing protein [Opitutaceae bacterium]